MAMPLSAPRLLARQCGRLSRRTRLFCSSQIDAMKFKVALCQFKVTPKKEENLQTAEKAIKIWNSAYETSEFPKNAEDIDGGNSRCTDFMSKAAKQHGITLVGGSIPESSNGKTYNTCLIFDKTGKVLGKHRKVHLFDIDIPGKQTFKESDTLTAGDSLTVVNTDCGKLGIGICYDIRFPEMAAIYARRGVQLLVYPGAFNKTTGPLHWELLQRARATDNQVFMATCSGANNPQASYSVHGHSMVVSPFGEILAKAEADPKTVYAEIDYSELDTRRKNMPLDYQRRKDLYQLVDKAA